MTPPIPQRAESIRVDGWGTLRPACIVCLGNELACDDGAGIQIGRCLCALPLPNHVTIRFCPQIDLDLVDYLVTADRVIFCDATKIGQVAGTVTVHDCQAAASWSSQPYCCHGIGLSDLIKIAGELEPRVHQRDVHLVGLEACVLDKFGVALTDEVRAAVPKAATTVLKLLGAGDDLIAAAEALTRRVQPPTIADVTNLWE